MLSPYGSAVLWLLWQRVAQRDQERGELACISHEDVVADVTFWWMLTVPQGHRQLHDAFVAGNNRTHQSRGAGEEEHGGSQMAAKRICMQTSVTFSVTPQGYCVGKNLHQMGIIAMCKEEAEIDYFISVKKILFLTTMLICPQGILVTF